MTALAYADERTDLYTGDALAVLAALPTSSIDALITDPPYSSGGMTRADRTVDTGAKYLSSDSGNQRLADFGGDNRDQRAYGYWMALWLSEALRVLKQGSVALLFTDWRQLPATTDALQAGGFIWRGVVPWSKPTYRPQSGRFAAQCEYVVWGSAGPMIQDYTIPALPGFYEASSPRDREHITQKPISIMRQLVRICPPEGRVLDPFMGAGTTGVACMIEGRRFTGVELVADYLDIAERRIRTAELQPLATGEQGALDLTGLGS